MLAICLVRSTLIHSGTTGIVLPIPVCFAKKGRRISSMKETLLSGRFLISLMQDVGRMTRGGEVWIMNGVLGYCFQVRPKSLYSRHPLKP